MLLRSALRRLTLHRTALPSTPTALRTFASKSREVPALTCDRFPVQRGSFAELTDADVAVFRGILGGPDSSRVITAEDEVQNYNIDYLRSVRGYGRVVVKPRTTAEVAELMRYCNERRLAVCPQGGNTGLVGGSVPVFDEVVLSLQLMDTIERIDEYAGIVVCQAGCVLASLEEQVGARGLVMPLDLGAKGSCHIGGNVSTNAGGLRLVRYGNLHGSVLGVEAVTAEGRVLDLMSNFKKDNTGYHLKHLFIGSEGTLGIITRLSMFCPTASRSVNVAFLGLNSYDDVKRTFLAAKRGLGEVLSSCEMIDAPSLDSCTRFFGLQSPIEKYPFYMLIETSGSDAGHDEEKLTRFLEQTMEQGLVVDGTVTNEPTKMKNIWKLRELIADSLLSDGYCFKYDISLPLDQFYDIVLAVRERVGDLAINVTGYGHVGDSNLHLNVSCARFTPEIYGLLEPFVYEYTSKLRGSVSAEHGIGFLKRKYLHYSKQSEPLRLMRQMKQLLDPNGILNPYKVLPAESPDQAR
ncbi:D-2-hydroxyglutarate dehydrogenase, mitochondrial [Anopheles stephensi]|uniref:D-2-hydroxyglutarate dehydrogenase, mitochondrial n=1 Tax=Anopheles stephensi TaxID=30069 RepID=UPI001658B53B|nr:D-2-hydroxyglutarate dehydrogenase, mitochondrial [Anopheles stephensi]XP_035891721.1 D-2-hydroxyglutarate dehydrogenase, mitochondrial [Anopheles stephensi]XP_035891722.1 D-2-hydroxyglutarate dehydrogenase, mitochondrial [Anopheles stephensi]XP_035891723.1 D-2-hydroxyglutarate dehydrogenase, mitochondrial [Anopheles stephensi]